MKQFKFGTSSNDDAKQFSEGHNCAYERDCCVCLLGWGAQLKSALGVAVAAITVLVIAVLLK